MLAPPRSPLFFLREELGHGNDGFVLLDSPAPMPESVGSRIMKSNAWSEGKGLGPREDGALEPVRADTTRLGKKPTGLGYNAVPPPRNL